MCRITYLLFATLFPILTWAHIPLSLEEKIGQILMVHFTGETANDDAKALIQEMKVGGIIYYNWANGLTSPSQVKVLSAGLQNLAAQNRHPIPLLLTTDQEGGRITRLKNGFTPIPSNQQIASSGDCSLAESYAKTMGTELLNVGINLNLAPVVDVNVNPKRGFIGDRSYGDTPEIVINYAKSTLKGFHSSGLLTTLKHYPGHGDVEIDSHFDLPIVDKSLDELKRIELAPYYQLANSTDAIMTAHILVPAIDNEHCATFSTKTLNYLRDQIGFKGIIISDSLVMAGARKQYSTIEEVAINAFNAGCDILLLGGVQLLENSSYELSVEDIRRIYKALIKAVDDGLISEERVDSSVARILKMKCYAGLE